MNAERWERAQLLFESALARPESERSAFLDSSCGDDPEVHDEVRSLLDAHEQAGDLEEIPTAWLGALAREREDRFAAGDRVADRYRIRRLLGRGGMGEVYEAWDEELSIPVALKTLHLEGASDSSLQRLKLEGLLARSVWHPNVCRVYDLGRHGDGKTTIWFLTMELLNGRTLARRLRDEGKLPPAVARRLAAQMAAGLGAAHQAGVIHRDFKPANVVLVVRDGEEQAIVTDFGIALAASGPVEEEPAIRGTPAYMAPEQLRGERASPAADLYALGVVLHEMVTGELPFPERPLIGALRLRMDRRPPRLAASGLDPGWQATLRRALAPDPAQRFARAEEMIEALAGGTSAAPFQAPEPGLRPGYALPAERDPFVGRAPDLEAMDRDLNGPSRLLTLVGAGGMGKTRLAVHYGWHSLGRWPGGVWFCDLTEARDANGIASAVAGSLGVPLGGGNPVEQLGRAIAGRGLCLVILDNFEQVVSHAEKTVGRWLDQATEARFTVTSRERLKLAGEIVRAVESLSLETGLDLFLARARGLRPGLDLAGPEAEAAHEVVRLVDGMPLAIELAAARMRVMSAAQIAGQMRRRFQLLTGGRTAHHETLRGTIDGSWDLLRPWEKAAWAQCSVFEGGFTLDAAEAVFDPHPWPEAPWVVDVLQSLVDKSLLRTWAPGAVPMGPPRVRFGMYVALQDYARLRLAGDGESPGSWSGEAAGRAAEERHGAWYARHGTLEAVDSLDRHGGVHRRLAIEPELANLTTACRRALERGDGPMAAALHRACWALLGPRGPFGVAVELGLEVLRCPGLDRPEKANVLTTLANAERFAGRIGESCSRFEMALRIHRETGNRHAECVVLDNLGMLFRHLGRIGEARRHAEQALAISREIGARRTEGGILGSMAILNRHEGRMEEARACYESALAIHREVGNRRMEGVLLSNLGILHYDHGRLDEAKAHLETALAVHREVGNRHSEGIALGNLGNLDQDRGRFPEARRRYEAALAIHREVGHRRFEGVILGDLGNLCRVTGQPDAAQAHLEAALAIHREVGNRYSEGVALGDLGLLHFEQGRPSETRACYESALAIHRRVGDRRFEGIVLGRLARLLHQQGETAEAWDALGKGEAILREVDERLELAKLLCFRSGVEWERGDAAAARAALDEARAVAERSGSGPESELGRLLDRAERAHGPVARA